MSISSLDERISSNPASAADLLQEILRFGLVQVRNLLQAGEVAAALCHVEFLHEIPTFLAAPSDRQIDWLINDAWPLFESSIPGDYDQSSDFAIRAYRSRIEALRTVAG